MGAVIMKMMSRTSTTSTKGTMLISESEDWVFFEMEAIVRFSLRAGVYGRAGSKNLREILFDLRGDFESKGVEALRKVANILQELIIKDYGRDGSNEAGGGGEERFGNTRSDGAKAGSASGAES